MEMNPRDYFLCIQLPWQHGKLRYGRIPGTASGNDVLDVGYNIDCHQGRWDRRNFYHDFNELRWTDHKVTEIEIFEVKGAMHHATSAQVQNAGTEELKPLPREGLIMYAVRIVF